MVGISAQRIVRVQNKFACCAEVGRDEKWGVVSTSRPLPESLFNPLKQKNATKCTCNTERLILERQLHRPHAFSH